MADYAQRQPTPQPVPVRGAAYNSTEQDTFGRGSLEAATLQRNGIPDQHRPTGVHPLAKMRPWQVQFQQMMAEREANGQPLRPSAATIDGRKEAMGAGEEGAKSGNTERSAWPGNGSLGQVLKPKTPLENAAARRQLASKQWEPMPALGLGNRESENPSSAAWAPQLPQAKVAAVDASALTPMLQADAPTVEMPAVAPAPQVEELAADAPALAAAPQVQAPVDLPAEVGLEGCLDCGEKEKQEEKNEADPEAKAGAETPQAKPAEAPAVTPMAAASPAAVPAMVAGDAGASVSEQDTETKVDASLVSQPSLAAALATPGEPAGGAAQLDPSVVEEVGKPEKLEQPTEARSEAASFLAGYKSELSTIMKVGGAAGEEMRADSEDVCGMAAEKAQRLSQNEASHNDPTAEARAAANAEQQTNAFGLARANEKQIYSVQQVIAMVAAMNEGPIKEQVRAFLRAITPTDPDGFDKFNAQPITGGLINAAIDRFSQLQGTAGKIGEDVTPEAVPNAEPLGEVAQSPLTKALQLGKDALPNIPDDAAELKQYLVIMDKVLLQEGVDPQELAGSPVPEYKQLFALREQLRLKAEGAPAAAQKALDEKRRALNGEMDSEEGRIRGEMHGERDKQHKGARGSQLAAIKRREAQRAKITATVNGIHGIAKATVEKKLADLETHSKQRFGMRVATATTELEHNVKRRKDEWKAAEYEKRGIVGDVGLWWTDNVGGGLDTYPEVQKMYEDERNKYLDKVDAEIKAIADAGNKVLAECKAIITQARTDVFTYLGSLKGEFESLGISLAKDISKKFDDLEKFVDKKKEELSEKLCKMRDMAITHIDGIIEKMKQESAGLLVQALNLGIDVLIAPFRWALGLFGYDLSDIDDVIGRVKRTFTFIISYPLEFAKRMATGIGDGFLQFADNIKQHLINTLVGWLTGALMDQPVTIPAKWDISGILQFIGSLIGIGSDFVMDLIRRVVPDEVVDQAEKLFPVFMRIPEEGPGALWEYIQQEAEEMKRMAMEGVRDAVISQLVIFGVQKLMNVLTLGGSAFADAAKAIYDMVLFFKNNWTKITDLVSKVFNTLSAVAENNTKFVADGVEGAMARGIQVMFGFFMTSLGLGGIVNSVIGVFRKIGDFLRKAVNKAVDFVVAKVKDTFGKLFGKKRGDGEDEDGNEKKLKDKEVGDEMTFSAGHEQHRLWFTVSGSGVELMVASEVMTVEQRLQSWEDKLSRVPEKDREEAKTLLHSARKQYIAAKKEGNEAKKEIDEALRLREQAEVGQAETADQQAEAAERNLKSILAALFDFFWEIDHPDTAALLKIGKHKIENPGRESHHVPPNMLNESIAQFYENAGEAFKVGYSVFDETSIELLNKRKWIKETFNGTHGVGLSAISLHPNTHRKGASAVHSSSLQPLALEAITKEVEQRQKVRIVAFIDDGSQLVANLQQPNWKKMIFEVYELVRTKNQLLGDSTVTVAQHPSDKLLIAVKGRDKEGLARIKESMKLEVQTLVRQFSPDDDRDARKSALKKKAELLDRIGETNERMFESSLENGLSAVGTALRENFANGGMPDGDPEAHPVILRNLRLEAIKIWKPIIEL